MGVNLPLINEVNLPLTKKMAKRNWHLSFLSMEDQYFVEQKVKHGIPRQFES